MIISQNDVAVIHISKLLLISTLITTIIIIPIVQSRYLRPSEHGLTFQYLPPRSPEMNSFFGESFSPPSHKPLSPVILGNSTPSSDSWWTETPEKVKESKVSNALVVATVVCGGTGVVLLLAAAFILAVHFYKRRLVSSSSSNNNDRSSNSGAVNLTSTIAATHK